MTIADPSDPILTFAIKTHGKRAANVKINPLVARYHGESPPVALREFPEVARSRVFANCPYASRMKRMRDESGQDRVGRRERSRVRLRLPARLITLDATQTATLADLSLTGARLIATGPVRVGEDAIVQWDHYEAFGRVVWTRDGQCGVCFDTMITPNMVIAARDLHDSVLRKGGLDEYREAALSWVNGAG